MGFSAGVGGNIDRERSRTIMRIPKSCMVLTIAAFTLLHGYVVAQTELVLHNFKSKEGGSPLLGLVFDSAGNLYGVTGDEGASSSGSVFKLSTSGGGWTETTLHSFNGASDGGTPLATLVMDTAGNLYGTTKLGGSHNVGVVYELTKSKSGTWSEKVLYNFGTTKDGEYPTGNLVFDRSGNIYGTTEGGGAYGKGTENSGGTAFKLTPPKGTGSWTEAVIHSFGHGTDGASPRANLIFDTRGNLYGTTMFGGSSNDGTVFELMPQSGSGWKETILYAFQGGTDGNWPAAGVVFDKAGNLYGTTVAGGDLGGGAGRGGTVFELSLQAGVWVETELAGFEVGFDSPRYPFSNLSFDSAGNLYGTTLKGYYGGEGQGTIFELMPQSDGTWLFSFVSGFTNGSSPGIGSLVFDSSGNIYGGLQFAGTNNEGSIFEIMPSPLHAKTSHRGEPRR